MFVVAKLLSQIVIFSFSDRASERYLTKFNRKGIFSVTFYMYSLYITSYFLYFPISFVKISNIYINIYSADNFIIEF